MKRLASLLAVLLMLSMVGWTTFSVWHLKPPTKHDVFPGTGTWAQATLDSLTLEQKVAQLFSARAYSTFRNNADVPSYEDLQDLVTNFGIGGLTFFQGDSYSQARLLNDLQAQAAVPLLVAQDMEWGAGMRLNDATSFPRAMAVGATRDTAYAYAIGHATAQEARAVGVHHIFAPVADVNNNPFNPIINVRSFGEEPDLVASMVTSFIRGAQDGGVLATAKHFPGHGDTATDSHADLPVLQHSRARLDSLELIPFRRAIDAGVMSVMTAHLAFPLVEPDLSIPASLSAKVTQEMLRDDLGFEGLIVTDALDMQAVTAHFEPGELAVRALKAGADMLLLSEDPYAARDAILAAIEQGELTEERIDASVLKILKAKDWAGLHEERQVAPFTTQQVVASAEHRALSTTIARDALTLLRNEALVLPLAQPGRILTTVLSDNNSARTGRPFTEMLTRFVEADTTVVLGRRARTADYAEAYAEASRAEVIVVPIFLRVRSGSSSIGLPDRQKKFVEDLIATGKPVVVVSFGNPYLVLDLSEQPSAYVAAYGSDNALQEAAAQALFGAGRFQSTLPVSIPNVYAAGEGLTLAQSRLRYGYPSEAGLNPVMVQRIDSLMEAAMDDHAFPGAAVAIGRGDVLALLEGYGHYTYDSARLVSPRSRFDVASLTKVVATTTALMQLYEGGHLNLDAEVARYLPAFAPHGKEKLTVRDLLTHTSGLPAWRPFYQEGILTREAVIDSIMSVRPQFAVGSRAQYSDFNMITLALLVEQISGQDFATYVTTRIFEPLGMRNTGFLAVGAPDSTVVPTENDTYFRNRLIQGEVHDETAWLLGGVAGHAGLFTTAEDLATFAYMLTNDGSIYGATFLKPETIRLFTTAVDADHHTRALGWDTKNPEGYSSAGQYFGMRSFGHTGFTGTSLWIDPDQKLFVILLTNRVYPTRNNRKLTPIRPALADIAYESIQDPEQPLTAR